MKRPDWDTYFMGIAKVVKSRANCLRGEVGVVIVKDRHIIATGYNGTPLKIKNCLDGGCMRCLKREKGEIKSGEEKDTCICVHGEQNAILQAAYHGTATVGSTLYTTAVPCNQCTKMILNSGITKVVCHDQFYDEASVKLLRDAGIETKIIRV